MFYIRLNITVAPTVIVAVVVTEVVAEMTTGPLSANRSLHGNDVSMIPDGAFRDLGYITHM